MKIQSVYKVPKGKLLKIFAEVDENKETLQSIRITGDFFAYPEEAIDVLEEKLKNNKLEKEELFKQIDQTIKDNNFEFIGLDAQGLVTGILMCVDIND